MMVHYSNEKPNGINEKQYSRIILLVREPDRSKMVWRNAVHPFDQPSIRTNTAEFLSFIRRT